MLGLVNESEDEPRRWSGLRVRSMMNAVHALLWQRLKKFKAVDEKK